MPWIESHTVLMRHRKLLAMARDLRLKPVHLLGHLHALWHAALEQQEDGDLSSWSDDLIAELSAFTGDAPQYVSLLQKHGWLDGKLIHDWWDYAGRYITKKYQTSNPARLNTIKSKLGRAILKSDPNSCSDSDLDSDSKNRVPKESLKSPFRVPKESPPNQPTNLPNLTNQPTSAGLDCDSGFGLEKRLVELGLKPAITSKYRHNDVVEVLRLYDTKVEKGEAFKNPQGWILSELKKFDTSDIPEEKITAMIEILKAGEAYARGNCPPPGKTLRQYAIEKLRRNRNA